MTTTPRLGFACKWIDTPEQVDGIKPKDACKKYNTGSTTITWLNKQTRDVAEEKLWHLMQQNIEATRLLVERVGNLEPHLRMVRLSSDILPAYTQEDWSYFWQKPDVREYCERHFARIGEIARQQDVKLSFHPGQFTVLASDNPDVVNRSIDEFEYHIDMARYMGYGDRFHSDGFKVNVHISGRNGAMGIVDALPRLSQEAKNLITIENEEITHGLDDCLTLAEHGVAIVLDIHHHWCREGEYIDPNDDRVKRVIDSWQGVRPTMHYSYSRDEHLPIGFDHTERPTMQLLLESGHKKQKLRAHSDFYPNREVNAWALSFLDNFDIMSEAKGKNLASFALAKQVTFS